MVISRQKNLLSVVDQHYSQFKLNIFKYQFNNLALFYCLVFLQYTNKMPSLPQAAFAVCKIREQNPKGPGTDNGPAPVVFNKKLSEYLPVKYNEKFMNAIWGHYNRYSPHNIKSKDAALAVSTSGKMLMAATATTIVTGHQPSAGTLNL